MKNSSPILGGFEGESASGCRGCEFLEMQNDERYRKNNIFEKFSNDFK